MKNIFVIFIMSFYNAESYLSEPETFAAFEHSFYKRFELIVSNFRFDFSSFQRSLCDNQLNKCKLSTTVAFNYLQETREIELSEENDPSDGIFLSHQEVWDEDSTYIGNSVYKETNTLRVKVEIYKKSSPTNKQVVIHETLTNMFKIPPNTEKLIVYSFVQNKKGFIAQSAQDSFGIFISYRCKGYTGYNCRFKCDNRTQEIECNYDTGEMFCKNPSFNNPPECSQNQISCSTEDTKKCKNESVCKKIMDQKFICVCKDGWTGKYCDKHYCSQSCDPNYGTCSGPNTCKCTPDYKSGLTCSENKCKPDNTPCRNGALCKIYENEIFCFCAQEGFTGKFCEIKCDPACVYGHCTNVNGSTFCNCFKGFTGEDCATEIIETIEINFGYVSGYAQKITHVSLFFTMFLITVIVLGIGSFLRRNIQKNIEIITRTEATLAQMNVQIQEEVAEGGTY